jgi:hypothetical protein
MKLLYREVSKQTTVPFIQITEFLLRNFSKEMCSLENVCKKFGAIRLIKKQIFIQETPFMSKFKEFLYTSATYFSKKKKNFRKRSKIEMF